MSDNNILAKAVKLEEGMSVTFPLWGSIENIELPKASPKSFNICGERITFVDEDGNIFAIPNLKGVLEFLINEEYERNANMCVFFSAGEAYPTKYKAEWEALLKEMRSTAS